MSIAQLSDDQLTTLITSDKVIDGILEDIDLHDSAQIHANQLARRDLIEQAEWDQRNAGDLWE